jgi:hypothetical protein
MDDSLIEKIARQAGLELYYEKFPQELKDAAELVENYRKGLDQSIAPADEPWPPMTAGDLA